MKDRENKKTQKQRIQNGEKQRVLEEPRSKKTKTIQKWGKTEEYRATEMKRGGRGRER